MLNINTAAKFSLTPYFNNTTWHNNNSRGRKSKSKLATTYPHQMATVSQDHHDPLVQLFHQARGSRQVGRDVTKGNSRVGRDLLGASLGRLLR
jgi:hypothetical protein